MPNTRPDLILDVEGICSACRSVERKFAANWNSKKEEWEGLVSWAKCQAELRNSPYHCIAAVSGGKDSTYIVAKCKEYGLNPLGVSFEPTLMSVIGQKNLENLQETFGIDVIQIKKNRRLYRKIQLYALRIVGDSEWPNHCGIYAGVVREAVTRNIPLVIWGENPQVEYAPPDGRVRSELDRNWLEEFGGILGLRVSDMEVAIGEDLYLYRWPKKEDILKTGLKSVFLGDYFFWDTVAQAKLVREKYGFLWDLGCQYEGPTHGSYWEFENLDDRTAVAFHDFLALCKYGYTRAMAQLSVEIRHGYTSRNKAVAIAREIGDYYPEYDEGIFCGYLDIVPDELRQICETFCNSAIWKRHNDKYIWDLKLHRIVSY